MHLKMSIAHPYLDSVRNSCDVFFSLLCFINDGFHVNEIASYSLTVAVLRDFVVLQHVKVVCNENSWSRYWHGVFHVLSGPNQTKGQDQELN